MRQVPFEIIKAAKEYDSEAVEFVFRHFAGYIASKCINTYMDEDGNARSFVDEDLRYQAEAALLTAISKFSFQAPSDDAG